MKIWNQADFSDIRPNLDGCTYLPAGDWRAVDFGGHHHLIFPAHCVLGDGVILGSSCVLGERCEVGQRFYACGGLTVSAYCRFGKEAYIPAGSRIDRGVIFGEEARFSQDDLELGDDVEIAGTCRLFGVRDVVGKSLIKIYMHGRSTVYAFETVRGDVYVHTMDATKRLEDCPQEMRAAVKLLRESEKARRAG